MPLHNEPKTLYNASRTKVDFLIDYACKKIWKECGSYYNEETQEEIKKLQDFLSSCIPLSVLNDILNLSCKDHMTSSYDGSTFDLRIVFALLMHPYINIFKVSNLDLPKPIISKIEDSFWISCLYKMSSLIVLDLSLVCTDEILETVGKCCPLLEQVTVISKMSIVTKGKDFNALKKMYHVSDKGLLHLTNCQKLKKLSLNDSNRSGLGKITDQGLCMLICSLPNLKIINYDYMGLVLQHLPQQSPPLKLCHIKDLCCNPSNVSMYNCLCPDLKVLVISLRTILGQSEREAQSEAIEEILTKSCFKFESLNQSFIHITNTMLAPLLATKGSDLTSISFGLGCSNFDMNTLVLIGHYCPKLKDLSISTMGPDSTTITLPKQNLLLFKNLKVLNLCGKSDWSINNSLLLCLSGGQISRISLLGIRAFLDDTFMVLLSLGHLSQLECLILHKHCYISSNTVWHFLQYCPLVNLIRCLYHSELTTEDEDSFLMFILNNNYNVDLKFDDGFYPWPRDL